MNRKQLAIEFAKSLNYPEIKKIILFGSVARGDDGDDSDIDILIITSNDNDEFKISDDIYSKVFDILINNGERISIKIRTLNYYNKYKHSSFLSNVENEGVVIG